MSQDFVDELYHTHRQTQTKKRTNPQTHKWRNKRTKPNLTNPKHNNPYQPINQATKQPITNHPESLTNNHVVWWRFWWWCFFQAILHRSPLIKKNIWISPCAVRESEPTRTNIVVHCHQQLHAFMHNYEFHHTRFVVVSSSMNHSNAIHLYPSQRRVALDCSRGFAEPRRFNPQWTK